MPLRFVSDEETYSIYTDEHGDEVLLAAGSMRRVYETDDAIRIAYEQGVTDRGDFENLFAFPDEADEYEFCIECSEWEPGDSAVSTEAGWVCGYCIEHHYTICEKCESWIPDTEIASVEEDAACENCRDRYSSYCDDCETSYWDVNADEHIHTDASTLCCNPRSLDFSIRADGLAEGATRSTGRLANDERVSVVTPADVISEHGMVEIRRALMADRDFTASCQGTGGYAGYYASVSTSLVGDQWKTARGTFPKRLRSHLYKEHGIKMSDALVAKVGRIGREHSTALDLDVAITRDLNMSADEFAHEESCWWSDYAVSRCVMKTNHGFGLRSFGTWGSVEGRAWVLAVRWAENQRGTKSLVATPEADDADAYIVFNGYHALEESAGARVMAAITGWDYVRSEFRGGEMYVNSGCHIVAPADQHKALANAVRTLHLPVH